MIVRWCWPALLVLTGCGQRDKTAASGAGGTSSSTVATATVTTGAYGIETTGPIGLDALARFDKLPYLRTAERALHESSYDRSGGNADFSVAPHYVSLDANGDKVLLDARGPGAIYRMWFTGQDPAQKLHVYFDGDMTPRIDMTLGDFFAGTKAPFLAPLVAGNLLSSGGFYSDVPLPFAAAIRVTASAAAPDYYFNIDYHLFDPTTPVPTWTGSEDASAAAAVWSNAGSFPIDVTGGTEATGTVDVPAGQSVAILDVDGPKQIVAIHLSVGGVFPVHPGQLTDSGRAHKGTSSFTLKLDPANQGAVLQRRLDHGVADQTALLSVDGAIVGTWTDRGSDATDRWRDDFFQLPAAVTAGRTSIDVAVSFVSSAVDWNEFYYWAYSRVRGAEVLTDQLDVGDPVSEAAHAYAVTNPTFMGTQTLTYPQPISFAAALDDLRMRISWDDEGTPSVDAPVGALFAQGSFGPGFVRAVPAGMSADGTMYLFFPMPFEKHAKLELVNTSAAPVDDVWYSVLHQPFNDTFANVGFFKTSYAGSVSSEPGKDALFIDADGAGQVVGVVESMMGPSTPGYLYLEGDEHVFVDGRRTASIQGTGTEDFYNGGWYFDQGLFSQPTHGWSAWTTPPGNDGRSMHRFFLGDAIPFRSHIRFGIQHGGTNDVQVSSSLLAYYYAQPKPRSVRTDSLVIGDAASEAAHGYVVMGQTWEGAQSFTFEEPDFTALTLSGRANKGSSAFTMNVDPSNRGILLRRVLNDGVGHQTADVYVDGTLVGRWYTPGVNVSHRWREEDFWLPQSVSGGKTKLNVTMQFVASDLDWNEFGYEAYSVFD